MTDKPIIFSGPMVRALLEGRKTQDRRTLKPQPVKTSRTPIAMSCIPIGESDFSWPTKSHGCHIVSCKPYPPQGYLDDFPLPYAPADRLWVREGFGYGCRPHPIHGSVDGIEYRADEALLEGHDMLDLYTPETPDDFCYGDVMGVGWRSPIHMPRWASRLTLILKDVRVQRVQEISEADAIAEGVRRFGSAWSVEKDNGHGAGSNTAAGCFRLLWNSIHGPEAWDANPWVAALTFDVHRCNIDQMVEAT